MSDLPTPETDRVWAQHQGTTAEFFEAVVIHARGLERDRAALMEVCSRLAELDLNGTDDSLVRFIVQAHQNSANTAIAAAHANFPTP